VVEQRHRTLARPATQLPGLPLPARRSEQGRTGLFLRRQQPVLSPSPRRARHLRRRARCRRHRGSERSHCPRVRTAVGSPLRRPPHGRNSWVQWEKNRFSQRAASIPAVVASVKNTLLAPPRALKKNAGNRLS